MQTTSNTWKALWASGDALLEVRAVIGGTDRSAELCAAPVINRATMQNGLSVGNVVSATCALALRTTAAIARSAPVALSMRLTDGTTASEWLPQGTFYISRRAKDPVTGVTALECYDALLKANAPWEPSAGSWPRSPSAVVTELAALLGVSVDSRTALPSGDSYAIGEPAEGTTIRDVLSTIAACAGGNWILTPANAMRLVPLISAEDAEDAEDDALDVAAVLNPPTVGDVGSVTGVRSTVDGAVTLAGDDTGIVIDVDIAPLLAADLVETLIGMTHQPFRLPGAVYDPAVELGDYVRYADAVAGVLCAETLTLSPGPRGELSAPDPAELADEYPYIGGSEKVLSLAKAYARSVVADLNDDLTQQEIFNRLTGNGAAQGMVLLNGQLYVNATYINTGYMSANRIQGGTIDGSTVQAKLLNIVDDNGTVVARFDSTIILGEYNTHNPLWTTHAEIDDRTIKLIDGYRDEVFTAGSIERSNSITDTFTVTISGASFRLNMPGVPTINWVSVNGSSGWEYDTDPQPTGTKRPYKVSVYKYEYVEQPDGSILEEIVYPAVGATVQINYDTPCPIYYYTFGKRSSSENEPGDYAIVEGADCSATGDYSYAQGHGAQANHRAQHVFGEYNTVDSSSADVMYRGDYIEIVGKGTADNNRSNARTLDWSGNEWIAGALSVGNPASTRVNLGAAAYINLVNLTTWAAIYNALSVLPNQGVGTLFIGNSSTLTGGKLSAVMYGTVSASNKSAGTYDFLCVAVNTNNIYQWRVTGLTSASATPTVGAVYKYAGTAV